MRGLIKDRSLISRAVATEHINSWYDGIILRVPGEPGYHITVGEPISFPEMPGVAKVRLQRLYPLSAHCPISLTIGR